MKQYDATIIGGGIAGMSTAARLQAAGLSTVVLEAHGQPGGCAGFYRRRGFSFDVGATTLVDFDSGGVGGELLSSIGMTTPQAEQLPGYVAWLPDRTVTLFRNPHRWARERMEKLGATVAHHRFWELIDCLASTFWEISRRGIKLPVRHTGDVLRAARLVGLEHLAALRFLHWTMGDALRYFHLRDDDALVGLLSMLIEDTVHSTVDDAPLINASLGITIRAAGLMRPYGGMRGFWSAFAEHYRGMGGELRVGCKVHGVSGSLGDFTVATQRGIVRSHQVVSAVPAQLTSTLAEKLIGSKLKQYLDRDTDSLGGALVVFLGVPTSEIDGQTYTHHQLLHDYNGKLGNGNNMFISVSSEGDRDSAPCGYRAVMMSTHCDWTTGRIYQLASIKSVKPRLARGFSR